MKFSERWLRDWVDPQISSGQLAEQLTMAGLEIESTVSLQPDWGRVVVGLVEAVAPHPGSADLRVCTVAADPKTSVSVVCGAPEVAVGKFYALALPGARLPNGQELKAVAVRGVQSNGMLCSRAELGLGDEAGRLLELDAPATAGMPLEHLLGLDDHIFDLAVTPNRGDCLSINGIAREVAVLNNRAATIPEMKAVAVSSDQRRAIHLPAAQACPRYLGRVIENVDVARRTPLWMAERLRRSEIRGINIVVDIANYVMLELGQPMHAFDHDRLQGDISVRWARRGEKLKCLDGQERSLEEDTLVIADAAAAVALAGIMGGSQSAISAASRHVFLESAFFMPEHVRGRARKHGLQTDASQRFERGVDPTLAGRAMERASALILKYCGGRAGPVTEAVSAAHLPILQPVLLRSGRVQTLLGVSPGSESIKAILERLGFTLQTAAAGWEVTAPAHRFDVALEADLIEEVARIHGYNRIPNRRPDGRPAMHRSGPDPRFAAWRRVLADRGYFEAITYSFVDEGQQARLLGDQPPVRLQNPIAADMAVMRMSLLPGLLRAVHYNQNRQQTRVRLFEIGRIYLFRPDLTQDYHIAGMFCGNIYPEQWDRGNRLGDFFDMKADVEAVLAEVDRTVAIEYQAVSHAHCQPGQAADILFNKQKVGFIGAIHPQILAETGMEGPVIAFEVDVAGLGVVSDRHFSHFSRFPSMRRDINLVLDRNIPVGDVLAAIRFSGGSLLSNLELFDVYEGEGVDSGKKSLTFGLTFQKSSSTLIDAEVEAALGGILGAVQGKFGAKLRD